MTDLSKLSQAELIAMVTAMQANPRKLTMKITEPKLDEKTGEMKGSTGALSVYGLGRFPITLYRSQWERLFAEVETVREFIHNNQAKLAIK